MSWDSHERRIFVRVKLPLKISILNSPHEISAKTENISAGGIRLLLGRKFPNSSIVNLKIYNIKKEPLSCQGKILWVFSRLNHSKKDLFLYDTGIEFYKIKKEDLRTIEKVIVNNLLKK